MLTLVEGHNNGPPGNFAVTHLTPLLSARHKKIEETRHKQQAEKALVYGSLLTDCSIERLSAQLRMHLRVDIVSFFAFFLLLLSTRRDKEEEDDDDENYGFFE